MSAKCCILLYNMCFVCFLNSKFDTNHKDVSTVTVHNLESAKTVYEQRNNICTYHIQEFTINNFSLNRHRYSCPWSDWVK